MSWMCHIYISCVMLVSHMYICHGCVTYVYRIYHLGSMFQSYIHICHGCVIYIYICIYSILVLMAMLVYIHIMVVSNMYICNILAQCSSGSIYVMGVSHIYIIYICVMPVSHISRWLNICHGCGIYIYIYIHTTAWFNVHVNSWLTLQYVQLYHYT